MQIVGGTGIVVQVYQTGLVSPILIEKGRMAVNGAEAMADKVESEE
jgi:hypothetical protein